MNACVWPLELEPLATIWPLSLIAVASLRLNPEPGGIRLLRFWNVPLLQIQAPLPDWPTITPWLLIASPTGSRPKVPRSVIVPPAHITACELPLAVSEAPTIWWLLLIPLALLKPPPP